MEGSQVSRYVISVNVKVTGKEKPVMQAAFTSTSSFFMLVKVTVREHGGKLDQRNTKVLWMLLVLHCIFKLNLKQASFYVPLNYHYVYTQLASFYNQGLEKLSLFLSNRCLLDKSEENHYMQKCILLFSNLIQFRKTLTTRSIQQLSLSFELYHLQMEFPQLSQQIF